ncbi:hypothetical protein ACERII_23810 [Evansella sp. AB-rgal1]|uniref:hypothetical protein n=1 Tax=Evansella sp. AB-rgal1 TaxID=3242696 RepID=UPI00359EBC2D
MFNRKDETKDNTIAEILLAGQSLSFKLSHSETITLMKNLEEVSYDFKRMETIKLFHTDGRLKSVINPLQISRIWFSN